MYSVPMQKRAGAIIIENNKLLLVTDKDAEFYWTPGGRLEGNESYLDALYRELDEELNVGIRSATVYKDLMHDNLLAKYFLVKLDGDPRIGNEINSFRWFSRIELNDNKAQLSPRITNSILPELLKDNLL